MVPHRSRESRDRRIGDAAFGDVITKIRPHHFVPIVSLIDGPSSSSKSSVAIPGWRNIRPAGWSPSCRGAELTGAVDVVRRLVHAHRGEFGDPPFLGLSYGRT